MAWIESLLPIMIVGFLLLLIWARVQGQTVGETWSELMDMMRETFGGPVESAT